MKTVIIETTKKSQKITSEKLQEENGDRVLRELIKDRIKQNDDGRPFFIANLDDIVRKHKRWTELMPRVQPFYAVKCNNAEPVVKAIAALGGGFDCASTAEFTQILDYGVETERIIYANPCKDPEELKDASEHGVNLMTFDNEDELFKVKNLYPDARLVLRILPQVRRAVHDMGRKFGCAEEDCEHLLKRAKDMGLNVVGVSFHVGSSCLDTYAYEHTLQLSRRVFDLAKDVGHQFNFLDIGGGFPGFEKEGEISLSDIAQVVNNSLEKYFPEEDGVKVIAEPGRYYVQSAFTLSLRVIARRVEREETCHELSADVDDSEKSFMYYLNDGIHGSFFLPILLEKRSPKFYVLENKESMPVFRTCLWGPTCNPHDMLSEDVLLPELDLGDWLFVTNMGAYTTVLGSAFNGIPPPKTHWIASQDVLGELGLESQKCDI